MPHAYNPGDRVKFIGKSGDGFTNGTEYLVAKANWDGLVGLAEKPNWLVFPSDLKMIKEHPDNIRKRKEHPAAFDTHGFLEDYWEQAPRWALYLVQDSDGDCKWSRYKPRQVAECTLWRPNHGYWTIFYNDFPDAPDWYYWTRSFGDGRGFNKDWKKAIQKRPKKFMGTYDPKCDEFK